MAKITKIFLVLFFVTSCSGFNQKKNESGDGNGNSEAEFQGELVKCTDNSAAAADDVTATCQITKEKKDSDVEIKYVKVAPDSVTIEVYLDGKLLGEEVKFDPTKKVIVIHIKDASIRPGNVLKLKFRRLREHAANVKEIKFINKDGKACDLRQGIVCEKDPELEKSRDDFVKQWADKYFIRISCSELCRSELPKADYLPKPVGDPAQPAPEKGNGAEDHRQAPDPK